MFCFEHLLILLFTTHTHTHTRMHAHTHAVFSTRCWQARPAAGNGTWAVVQGCTLRRAPHLVWCSVTILKGLIIFEQGIMCFHFGLSPSSSTAGPVQPASMADQHLAGGREETFRAGSSTFRTGSSTLGAGNSTLELESLSFLRKAERVVLLWCLCQRPSETGASTCFWKKRACGGGVPVWPVLTTSLTVTWAISVTPTGLCSVFSRLPLPPGPVHILPHGAVDLAVSGSVSGAGLAGVQVLGLRLCTSVPRARFLACRGLGSLL